jgi:AcrR family transcriptional regulator
MENNNKGYKQTILSEAKEIAIKQGITKVDIRSVAKNSGIAIGTVYNYFPSKGDLLVAVIEDFWEGAFADVDWRSFAYEDFYDNLEKIYNILYIYLNKFKENWLEELSFLKTQEKLLGKQKQTEYFKKICNRIKDMMEMDNNIKQYQWTDVISKEKTAEFIFENMIMMLKKGDKNMSFFIGILKKIMSN